MSQDRDTLVLPDDLDDGEVVLMSEAGSPLFDEMHDMLDVTDGPVNGNGACRLCSCKGYQPKWASDGFCKICNHNKDQHRD